VKRILLILDDQPMYGRSLARALRADFDIRLATDVEQAEAAAVGIDIALVDIRLNEGDPSDRQGLEFIRWLRGRNPDIKIISMTALENRELDNSATKSGANYFLRKPIVISKLRDLLTKMVQDGAT